MKEGQEQIFFATGETREQILRSPHLEAFKAKATRCCCSPTRSTSVGGRGERVRRQTAAVGRQGRVDLDSRRKRPLTRRARGAVKGLRRPADVVAGDVGRARQGSAVVHPPDGFTGLPDHRRIRHHAGARALVPSSGQDVPNAKRILELNAGHRSSPVCAKHTRTVATILRSLRLRNCFTATALLAEGGALEDPARFAELLADRLTRTV